jgi:hypothetical protein
LCKEQGRIAEALGLYERALDIKERLYGAEPPELTGMRTTINALRTAP